MPCTICGKKGHNKTTCKNIKVPLLADEDNTCPICYEDIGDTNTCTTECGHKFCMKCMVTHLQRNQQCPMCRTQVAPEIEKEDEEDEDSWDMGYRHGHEDAIEAGINREWIQDNMYIKELQDIITDKSSRNDDLENKLIETNRELESRIRIQEKMEGDILRLKYLLRQSKMIFKKFK
jgi:hypothetical protein